MNDFQTWIDSRNQQWSNPTGFLAVTSINWLGDEPQYFEDVTGSWWANDHEVHAIGFEGADERVWNLAVGSELTEPTATGVLEIASRGGRIILRPRNPNSPALSRFDGARTFDYNPQLSVTATLVSDEKQVGVSSFAGELGNNYESPGRLRFDLNSETVELVAFKRPDPKTLWVIFRDATSGKSTYGTGRSVSATHIEGDNWSIDFNKSANFPCSYTDFATCPLAPRENHLSVAIEGGEKTPPFRVTSSGLQDQ